MIESLSLTNFKSWVDSGKISLAPLTVFFGANSSGKSSILQMLLLLKQSTSSLDKLTVLRFGGNRNDLIDLGSFEDVISFHDTERDLGFSIRWKPSDNDIILDGDTPSAVTFTASVAAQSVFETKSMSYEVKNFSGPDEEYSWSRDNPSHLVELIGDIERVHKNIKSFGLSLLLQDPMDKDGSVTFRLNTLHGSFDQLFTDVFYMGPLRDEPKRLYHWTNWSSRTTGARGEGAFEALMNQEAMGALQVAISGYENLRNRLTHWFKYFRVADDVQIHPIDRKRHYFEILIKTKGSPVYVSITEVGFGLPQLLPIIIESYLVPEGSTVLLEHPELHLHPSVQADLGDFLIDVSIERNLQFIVESHSEHLLRRIQRRIAETEKIKKHSALYFCKCDESGSEAVQLELDDYGEIKNWPPDFFGPVEDDLMKMMEARLRRQKEKKEAVSQSQKAIVIDTCIWIHAGSNQQEYECNLDCAETCLEIVNSVKEGAAKLLLDSGGHILGEYKVHVSQGSYLGQLLLAYRLNPHDRLEICDLSEIDPPVGAKEGIWYENLPNHAEYLAFDPDDRPFLAVAHFATAESFAVTVFSDDSDWCDLRPRLKSDNIDFVDACGRCSAPRRPRSGM